MIEHPKFAAGVGLDPASGLGTPNGTKLLAALQGTVTPPPIVPPPIVPPPITPPPTGGMTAAQFQANVRGSLRKGFQADIQHESRIERWYAGHFALLADNIVANEPVQ